MMTETLHIAQMNFGRMKFPLDDPRMKEFAESLDEVYALAERSPGFVWRISDEEMAEGLMRHGYDALTSATVSVWTEIESLKSYTLGGLHGTYLKRSSEWFERIDPPQLVIWSVAEGARPSVDDAFERSAYLRDHGPSEFAYGWDGQGGVTEHE